MNSQKININPQQILKNPKQSYKPISHQSKYKSKSNVTSSNNIIYIVGGVFLIIIIIYVITILRKSDDVDDNDGSQLTSGIALSLSSPSEKKEIFHIKKDYSKEEANSACKILDSRLATYSDLIDAADDKMSLCEYGWIKGEKDNPTTGSINSYFINQDKECTDKDIEDSNPYDSNKDNNYAIYKGGAIIEYGDSIGVNCYGVKPKEPVDEDKIAADKAIQDAEKTATENKEQEFRDSVMAATIVGFNKHDSV